MSAANETAEYWAKQNLVHRIAAFVNIDFPDPLAEAKRRFPDFRVSDEVTGKKKYVKALWTRQGKDMGIRTEWSADMKRSEAVRAVAEFAIVRDEMNKAEARGCTAEQILQERIASGKPYGNVPRGDLLYGKDGEE